jgi:hypothetical protein
LKDSKYKLSNHGALPAIDSSVVRSTKVTLQKDQNEFYRRASFAVFSILFE